MILKVAIVVDVLSVSTVTYLEVYLILVLDYFDLQK